MSGNLPFGFGAPDSGGNGFDMSSLGAALQQLGQMLQNPSSGPVNWPMVQNIARQALATAGDPSIGDAQRRAVAQSVRLADLWLDEATTFPAVGQDPQAWSRSEWFEATLPMWQRYVEPIAIQMQQVMTSAVPSDQEVSPDELEALLPEQLRGLFPGGVPDEMAAMLRPMLGMVQQLGAAAFSMQLGQSLAALAQEVVSAGDIGIPLTTDATCALLPNNIDLIGAGIGVSADDVRIYLALRESAHQRLFAHVAWLRPRLVGAIEEYAGGIRVDTSRLGDAMAGVDLSNPEALQQLMASGLLQPADTDEQRTALARLETLLALVEGWVDDVVEIAIGGRMPSAVALRETMRRRRAAGGPAEKMFATLVGMELRPRSLREAATLFAAVRSMGSMDDRDGLWGHPDLLPSAEDLTDPLGFIERSNQPDVE
ncbi:hydrolase [Actinomycetes bacterium]|nr:hydrolase [Actinomycetes bacterium]